MDVPSKTDVTLNPTAVQADHDVHDTEFSTPPAGEGTKLQPAANAAPSPMNNSTNAEHTPATKT